MKWYLVGDRHGIYTEYRKLKPLKDQDDRVAVIVLGDCGLNYYLDERDNKLKKYVNNLGILIYCVRGNHEERPELACDDMVIVWDELTQGYVYKQEKYPNIRYFIDGKEYSFTTDNKTYSALVIGGAYSVDKYYRLLNNWNWFKNEQLSKEEMLDIEYKVFGKPFDFVFSHTCPLSWQPTDLFLSNIDQTMVDNTMEIWLDELKDKISWGVYCFGHYHADRIECPYVEMFYKDIENMDDIWNRWKNYKETGELDWWLEKGPKFYWAEENNKI
jgi:3-oxoacid CoA-transferase subunit A